MDKYELMVCNGVTMAVVTINLDCGFGPMKCTCDFSTECERYKRSITLEKEDDPGMKVDAKSMMQLTMLTSPKGTRLRITVEGEDDAARCIAFRLASALEGTDTYNLDFNDDLEEY
jgi:phosphotransferase system HPr (HPr) family protein